MSRNKVTDKGAASILKALKINTRVKTLFIDYGNQIKDKKLINDIQVEIEANNQIGKEAKDYLQ
jgi:formiminotetrahydrofolate cyclodeaminase